MTGAPAVSGEAQASQMSDWAGLQCVQPLNQILFRLAIFAESASNPGCLQGSDVAKNQPAASKTPLTVQQLPFLRRLPVPCRLDRQSPAISV